MSTKRPKCRVTKIIWLLLMTTILSEKVSIKKKLKKELTPFFQEKDIEHIPRQKTKKVIPLSKPQNRKLQTKKNKKTSILNKINAKQILKKMLVNGNINNLDNASSKTILKLLRQNQENMKRKNREKTFHENQRKFEMHEQDTNNLSKQLADLNQKMFLASTKLEEFKIRGTSILI